MNILQLKLFIEALIIFQSNLSKNLLLLILPQILKIQHKLKDYDRESYILFSYTCYYYGAMLGVFFWRFLDRFVSRKTNLILSLISLAVTDYIISQTASFKEVQIFQFLRGFSINFQQIGNAYVHRFVDKSIREQAFEVENIAQSLGNLLSPFIGQVLFELVDDKAVQFFIIISIALLVSTFSLKFVKHLKKKQKFEQEEESQQILEYKPTIIQDKTIRNILKHSLFNNALSRKYIYVYVMSSIIFQADFVYSTLLFMSHQEKQKIIFKKSFYLSEIMGGLITIYFIDYGHNTTYEINFINKVLTYIMHYQFLLLFLTPITHLSLQYITIPFFKYALVYLLFFLKISMNYYIYNWVLIKLINKSIVKPYRSKLNRILIVLKNGGAAFCFTFLLPKITDDSEYSYFFTFVFLAALQLSCSIIMKNTKVKNQEEKQLKYCQKFLQFYVNLKNRIQQFFIILNCFLKKQNFNIFYNNNF